MNSSHRENKIKECKDHIPVMLKEVIQSLSPQDGAVYVDGTFGAGGYTRAILEAADCKVYAIDRDPNAIKKAQEMAKEFPDRLIPVKGCFGDVEELLKERGVKEINGLVVDLGVSSMQLDTAERGFSFQSDGPLDMRMSEEGITAADVVNTATEEELADIFFHLGEERGARRIARLIVETRKEKPIETTRHLAEVVHKVIPKRPQDRIDPATKSFQGLRIYVNDELGELNKVLNTAERLLPARGRLVVVSFHSLEDRAVKRFLKHHSGQISKGSRHMPETQKEEITPIFEVPERKGLVATEEEIAVNPRARSARLRYAIRTEANPYSEGNA